MVNPAHDPRKAYRAAARAGGIDLWSETALPAQPSPPGFRAGCCNAASGGWAARSERLTIRSIKHV